MYVGLILPKTKKTTNVGLNCSLAACFANNQIKSEYQKYYHPLNIIPIALISVVFMLSIIFNYQNRFI